MVSITKVCPESFLVQQEGPIKGARKSKVDTDSLNSNIPPQPFKLDNYPWFKYVSRYALATSNSVRYV